MKYTKKGIKIGKRIIGQARYSITLDWSPRPIKPFYGERGLPTCPEGLPKKGNPCPVLLPNKASAPHASWKLTEVPEGNFVTNHKRKIKTVVFNGCRKVVKRVRFG